MTLLKMTMATGRTGYHNQDRSNTIRIRPLKESRYFPAVVIGGDDLLTEGKTPYWGAYYGVLTKTIGFRSGHQLQLRRVGIFIKVISLYIIRTFRRSSLYSLFLSGIEIHGGIDTHGWNIGAAMRFWKHLSVNVFTREFTCVSAGLRYECTLIH